MDQTSIAKLNQLHPKLRPIALEAYAEMVSKTPANVHPVIDQTERSFAESDKIYQQGRTTPGDIVSNAPAGKSWHNYALAFDTHMVRNGKDIWFDSTPAGAAKAAKDPDYAIIIDILKRHGFGWGGEFPGTFRDVPHFENKLGQTLSDLLAKYNAKDFIPGTQYVKI